MNTVLTLPGATLTTLARRRDLVVRSLATWPESEQDTLPGIAGFVESSFSPLVAEAAERCLRRAYVAPPENPPRTGVVVMSPLGDVVSARRVNDAVTSGARIGPLLFFQSVPNAVAGHIAARWGLTGPVVCVSSTTAGLDVAGLLIDDGDADEVLVILAEQEPDRAAAALVSRGGQP